ncbi:sporulation-specific protein 75 [[Candida] railenensis]|uniref:Sporulation-specific protein 75 n=1 Tax=[Candida] railenensis TaxID=45579 RepID=A0A9P0QS08_9ASCO|nr:sporulation-specific protein 75 [[Candida] railenensis]
MSLEVFPVRDVYNYTELTRSYMGIFYSDRFAKFLNTTQTGHAHSSSGMQFSILVKSIFTSLCLCSLQLTLFCFFRPIFKSLYQPRCYCVPNDERMDLLPSGFLSWVIPTMKHNINYYLSLGLDAYFLVRFIHILLLYFICVGSMNILILIPLNWSGSSSKNPSQTGLDKLSLSNISPSKIERLNIHFLMSIFTIGLFHWLIVYELQSFVKIRHSRLLSDFHKSKISTNTILIKNVPEHLRNYEALRDLFQLALPGCIRNIWFLYEFSHINDEVQDLADTLQILELEEILQLSKMLQNKDGSYQKQTQKVNEIMFHPPIQLNPFVIPVIDRRVRIKLPGWFRYLCLSPKVSQRQWCIDSFGMKLQAIDMWKQALVDDKIKKHNRVFIQFNSQREACIAHQCLLSQYQGNFDKSIMETNPKDVIWSNVVRENSIGCLIERYFVTILLICLIILYVIPVSFIGLFSHLPWLIQILPFLKWMYALPENIRETILSLLPSILLSLLTELVLGVFKFLIYFKGKPTQSELELDLQIWYFAFLFVQQFLVVTISTSVTVVFKQLIDQPTSIPVLLATNLPKAATFFFSYISVKALTFCGNSFLRIDQLILRYTKHKLQDKTPRQIFTRLTSLLKVRWGSVYPVYSVYGSIGLAYCIISPLISVFIVFFLSLSLLYYKYALRYIYSHVNNSETNGRLYPIALLHLFSGVYCLECCMIGTLFLSRNDNGRCPLKLQGWIMSLILLTTICFHITLYGRYYYYFSNLPILEDKSTSQESQIHRRHARVDECDSTSVDEYYSNLKLLMLHPSYSYEPPRIWLPDDGQGLSSAQINQLENEAVGLSGGTNKGAKIKLVGRGWSTKISISEAPPDFK